MTTITFGPGGVRELGAHLVYLKQKWQDEWTLYTSAHCTDATWCAAPSMPTATVVWPYGVVKHHFTTIFGNNLKLDVDRWYIKVEWITDESAVDGSTGLDWYGVVSDVEDRHEGFVTVDGTKYATGQQILHCYGLEHLLNQNSITTSMVYLGVADIHESPLPITFNAGGFGNRTDGPFPLTPTDDTAYIFDGTPEIPSSTDRKFWDDWSTRDIVQYLLRWKGPSDRGTFYNRSVPFRLTHAERLDDTDKPVVHQEGATPLSLLYRLIDRRRLMSFRLNVNENTTPHTVELEPFSFSGDGINFALPGVFDIPANNDTIDVVHEYDELTNTAVRTCDVQTFDRVVVRGAHRTSTCTMFHKSAVFEAGWTSTQETAYEAGASGVAGYGTWDTLKQQVRNQEVRAHDDLRPVYSWFRIPTGWDGSVGVYNHATNTNPAFIDDDGTAVADIFVRGCAIEPYLPLYEGVDYSGSAITDGPAEPRDWVYRRPCVFFKRPTDGRYMAGEKMAQLSEGECDPTSDGNNPRWSAYARTQPNSRIIEVHVTGEPQHVIAQTDFSGQTVDRDLGDFDYKEREMLVTLCVRECRFAEGAYPATSRSTLIDAQRVWVIYAGDQYRQDYVVPRTVLDVANDGTVETTTNGGFVRDDTTRLDVMARIAYEWYKQARTVVSIATYRLRNDIEVGNFLTTIGDDSIDNNPHYQEINSPVTRVRIRNPIIEPGGTNATMMEITTSAGEMDAMNLVPPPPHKKKRRLGE